MSVERGPSERRDQLACDAALFGLDDGELAELAALDGGERRAEIELAAGEIAALAFEARRGEEASLPAELAAKILARSGAKVIPFPRAPAVGLAVKPAPRRRASVVPWLVAAAAIVIAVMGWLRREPPPVTVTPPVPSSPSAGPSAVPSEVVRPESVSAAREALLALVGTVQSAWTATADASARGASGDVIWHSGAQRGFMRFKGLEANDPATSQYQLWIFDAERDERYPVDGGVFDVGPGGEVVVPIAAKLHVRSPKLFAITVEKPGGVVVSKRERIVLTASLPPT